MTMTRRKFATSLAGFASLTSSFPTMARAASQGGQSEIEKALLSAVPILGEHSMGSDNAPVVMFEYGSLTCTESSAFNADYWPSIKADFVDTGKVRFIFREFPLDNLALRAFMILRCVPDDKYFSVLDLILTAQKTWRNKGALAELTRLLQTVGLNELEVQKCANDRGAAKSIFESQKAGMKQFGITSTPTFFVAGLQLDGKKDPASIRPAIEAALAKT